VSLKVIKHTTQPDVLLRAGGGYGDLHDIDLTYINRTDNDSGSFVGIQFGTTAGSVRNIRVNLDIVTNVATSDPSYGFYIAADTSNQAHRLAGLTISGRVEGDVIIGHTGASVLSGTDAMREIAIRDFIAVTQTHESIFDVTRLVDNLTLDNVYHSSTFSLTGTAPSTFRFNCIGVQAANLNCGVGFSGTTSVASGNSVAHSMQVAPTVVTVTPTVTGLSDIFVSTITTASFNINFAGGGTHTFYWTANR
jgi:hypothetical protein